jgi:hypothetical protein
VVAVPKSCKNLQVSAFGQSRQPQAIGEVVPAHRVAEMARGHSRHAQMRHQLTQPLYRCPGLVRSAQMCRSRSDQPVGERPVIELGQRLASPFERRLVLAAVQMAEAEAGKAPVRVRGTRRQGERPSVSRPGFGDVAADDVGYPRQVEHHQVVRVGGDRLADGGEAEVPLLAHRHQHPAGDG